MAASILGRKLGGQCSIHVIESPEPIFVGHAVATLPPFLELLRFLGIDQNDFIDKTQSTYRLAQRFVDWASPGTSFWHPSGALGALIERRPFYHFWHKARAAGLAPALEFFSLETAMAAANRFIFPTNSLGVAQHMRYALHIDAGLAARYLRTVAERAGTIRLERKVVSVTRDERGNLDELQFEDGGKLRAELFIDNTPRGQLIGEFMECGWQDWKKWLPADRIVAAPVPLENARPPYMRVTAHSAGWSWRIPLQQTASVGHVYSSAHQGDAAALDALRTTAGADFLGEPRRSEFGAGRREKFWDRNVVALGNASGFLEPLVGSEMHLLSHALFNLLDHFPDKQFDPANIASYNSGIGEEFERIRDFILLHYCLPRRDDSPFWQTFTAMALPERLAQSIAMYQATGRIVQSGQEQFSDLDWFYIFAGIGITPRDYDPLVDTVDFEQVKRLMLAISQKVSADVAAAPTHDSFFATANVRLAGARKAAVAAQVAG